MSIAAMSGWTTMSRRWSDLILPGFGGKEPKSGENLRVHFPEQYTRGLSLQDTPVSVGQRAAVPTWTAPVRTRTIHSEGIAGKCMSRAKLAQLGSDDELVG